MTARIEQAQAREALRKALGAQAGGISDLQARKLLVTAHWDADLAATAATMRPRPEWVRELLGP